MAYNNTKNGNNPILQWKLVPWNPNKLELQTHQGTQISPRQVVNWLSIGTKILLMRSFRHTCIENLHERQVHRHWCRMQGWLLANVGHCFTWQIQVQRDKVFYFILFQLLLCKYIGNNLQTWEQIAHRASYISNFEVSEKETVMLTNALWSTHCPNIEESITLCLVHCFFWKLCLSPSLWDTVLLLYYSAQ